MNRTAKIARQSVLVVVVAATAAWLSAAVALNQVSHTQVVKKVSSAILLADGPVPCPKCRKTTG
jgi:hypothetical protein